MKNTLVFVNSFLEIIRRWTFETQFWFYSCQVLPARTHPEIAMNGTGGYLLSGITVEPETPSTEAEHQAKKPKLDECG